MKSKFNNSIIASNDFGNNLRDDVLKFQLEHDVAANLHIDSTDNSVTVTLVNKLGKEIGTPQTFNLKSSQGAITDVILDEFAQSLIVVFEHGDPITCNVSSLYETLNDLAINKQDKLESGVNIKTINNEDITGPGNINITGEPGLSAYEIAKLHGYTGTEEEWLLSLRASASVNDLSGDINSTSASDAEYNSGATVLYVGALPGDEEYPEDPGGVCGFSWEKLKDYKAVVFSGYKHGISTESKTSIILDPNNYVDNNEVQIFGLFAMAGENSKDYRLLIQWKEEADHTHKLYWWSDYDQPYDKAGQTYYSHTWLVTKIIGIR